jgi:hypothetical protein
LISGLRPRVRGVRVEERGEAMSGNENGHTETKTHTGNGNGGGTLTAEKFQRLIDVTPREIDILSDGTVQERPRGGDAKDEAVTRTLKTGRTWY